MSKPLSANERIKEASQFLRGTLQSGLRTEETGAISDDDAQLVKFHGMYLQDDRDLRPERTRKKMEKAFSFMLRLRIPGGICTPRQWLSLDQLARDYAGETLRLTTRQTFQFHGVIKSNVKTVMKAIDASLLDTLAACGDVNRNVLATSNPHRTDAHAAASDLARAISERLLPRTPAYREIWLDGEKVAGGEEEVTEPIYGRTYLPRKFKISVAVPPDNDVDVFAQDLGFIAIVDRGGKVSGWNVTVGGGMGMTHGEPETYPRTADVLGFCKTKDALAVAEAVVTVQRDWGDRTNRKHARLKYTIEDRGLDAFRVEVERRSGIKLGRPRPFHFAGNHDRYGWIDSDNGLSHLTLFIENGRIRDEDDGPAILTGLREIARVHRGEFRITANQNLIVANVAQEDRPAINAIVRAHRLISRSSGLRRNSLACVALPSCGLALAESERYLPSLVTRLETLLADCGLADDDITIRMTGCPNGCARPYISEIGLVGKGPDRYNLYLGGAFDGSHLSKLYLDNADEERIVEALAPLFAAYARDRESGERFSAFLIRTRVVAATENGRDFHDNTGPLSPPLPRTDAVA